MKTKDSKYRIARYEMGEYYQTVSGTLYRREDHTPVKCEWKQDLKGMALVDQFGVAHQFSAKSPLTLKVGAI